MATLIVLIDRKSHSFKLGGREYSFKQNKGKYTTDKQVIAYVEAMPRGMFSVAHGVEPPKPKGAAASAEPLDRDEGTGGVEGAPTSDEPAAEGKPVPRRGKRKKVTPDDE